MTPIDICNAAISNVKGAKPIKSFSWLESMEAFHCSSIYHVIRRDLLRKYRWPFSIKTVDGPLENRPDDLLAVLSIEADNWADAVDTKIISTSYSNIGKLTYVADEDDVDKFSPEFKRALVLSLTLRLSQLCNTDIDSYPYVPLECKPFERELHAILASTQDKGDFIKVKLSPGAVMPERAHLSDIGYDVRSVSISWEADPNGNTLHSVTFDTGVAIEPPPGFHIEVLANSRIAKKDLFLSNGVALIDPDYRGTIKMVYKPVGTVYLEDIQKDIHVGDVCGQLVIRQSWHKPMKQVDSLSSTERGTGGFGSTENKNRQ